MAIASRLVSVRAAMERAAASRAASLSLAIPTPVRLVAVSKTHPAERVREAYDAGHRHFGENYAHELVEKCSELPDDVEWHFVGHLQGNKVALLVNGCPSLACVETLDSEKLARSLDKRWRSIHVRRKLRVMVQVNSSGESTKNGVAVSEVVPLCRVISSECLGLEIAGLMTVGAPDYSGCRTSDFEVLHRCRKEVAEALEVDTSALELSIGMSADFQTAILEGSTSVRVGSLIFGPRPAKEKPERLSSASASDDLA